MIELLNLIATTEDGQEGTPTDTISTTETVQESTPVETPVENTPVEDNTPIMDKYSIDGEEYSIDDIREWKKSGLRQSDYTRKTQELAKQRKEAQEALEVFNYLQSKPDLLKKLVELDGEDLDTKEIENVSKKIDPVQKEIQDIKTQLMVKEIDRELERIMSNDKTVTDVELLEIANEYKCDVNKAYTIWRGINFDKIIKAKELETKRALSEEIQKNADRTRTLVTQDNSVSTSGDYGLDDTEKAWADKLGMSYEEYSRYKTN